MKRALLILVAAVVAAALLGVLVHAVLVAAHVAEPAATTVDGITPRRLWATTIALLAIAGVVVGALALARPGRKSAVAALVAGLVAVVNGGVNLALATGGPGTGNGVVGAAAAVVLGLVAMALGAVALSRRK